MAGSVRQRHDPGRALPPDLHALDADTLRQLLIAQNRELAWRQAKRSTNSPTSSRCTSAGASG